MTIRVELNPETEARLDAEARSQGVPLEKLAERLLKQALIANSVPHGALTVDEFHHMLKGMAEGSEKLPNLPTESFSPESFYAGTPEELDTLLAEGLASKQLTENNSSSSLRNPHHPPLADHTPCPP